MQEFQKTQKAFNSRAYSSNMNFADPVRGSTSQLSERQMNIIRHKLGKRKEDLESIPSEISSDEWAEITKYHQDRDLEKKRKEKEDYHKKK